MLRINSRVKLTNDLRPPAVIQADANRYAGANKCTLWTAFAKRGLGYGNILTFIRSKYHPLIHLFTYAGATTTKADSTTLPSGC